MKSKHLSRRLLSGVGLTGLLVVGLLPAASASASGVPAKADDPSARPAAAERGATLPYTEYEAEAADYDGTLLTADPKRTFGHTNFASESSGRESVRLDSTGQFVEFTSTGDANSIVVRNSIPDAPGGGGIDATLSLYADGAFVQKLDLSSKHSWLYGTTDDPESLTNTPRRTPADCSTSRTPSWRRAIRRARSSSSSATPGTTPPSTSST